ncbi:unnamed protein product [Oikopleura dioica]|uniref:Uncharacterized protein n=1 Tax=Oikopleura dioica TaxID=34765 RepID=E4WS87_OIKDI|nr:unnamed protein product [Oikopleura dioica]
MTNAKSAKISRTRNSRNDFPAPLIT